MIVVAKIIDYRLNVVKPGFFITVAGMISTNFWFLVTLNSLWFNLLNKFYS